MSATGTVINAGAHVREIFCHILKSTDSSLA